MQALRFLGVFFKLMVYSFLYFLLLCNLFLIKDRMRLVRILSFIFSNYFHLSKPTNPKEYFQYNLIKKEESDYKKMGDNKLSTTLTNVF